MMGARIHHAEAIGKRVTVSPSPEIHPLTSRLTTEDELTVEVEGYPVPFAKPMAQFRRVSVAVVAYCVQSAKINGTPAAEGTVIRAAC